MRAILLIIAVLVTITNARDVIPKFYDCQNVELEIHKTELRSGLVYPKKYENGDKTILYPRSNKVYLHSTYNGISEDVTIYTYKGDINRRYSLLKGKLHGSCFYYRSGYQGISSNTTYMNGVAIFHVEYSTRGSFLFLYYINKNGKLALSLDYELWLRLTDTYSYYNLYER